MLQIKIYVVIAQNVPILSLAIPFSCWCARTWITFTLSWLENVWSSPWTFLMGASILSEIPSLMDQNDTARLPLPHTRISPTRPVRDAYLCVQLVTRSKNLSVLVNSTVWLFSLSLLDIDARAMEIQFQIQHWSIHVIYHANFIGSSLYFVCSTPRPSLTTISTVVFVDGKGIEEFGSPWTKP